MYPALLPLMRTPRLPLVDRTDAPADLNGLVRFAERRIVVSVRVPSTVIRPIVTYASETWVLKETIIQKLLVFERKVLRRIFGPTKENQIWRINP